MSIWKLDSHQRVSVDCHRNVNFKHYIHGKRKGVTLIWRQFLNLNDIIHDLETYKYYPLGKNVWLQYYNDCIQLYHCRRNIHFTFHYSSWRKYVKETHFRILSFVRHGASLHGRQHAASHETLFQNRSRSITSTSSEKQTVSGKATNVGSKNEQWEKSTNLSKWNSANSGRPFSFISTVNALGATANVTTEMEEGEVCDIESGCGQSGDFCSIE